MIFRNPASSMTWPRASGKKGRRLSIIGRGGNMLPGPVTREHLNSTSTLRRKRIFTSRSSKSVVGS